MLWFLILCLKLSFIFNQGSIKKKLDEEISLDCDKIYNLKASLHNINESLLQTYEDECFDNYLLSSPRINIYANVGDNATCECQIQNRIHSIREKLSTITNFFKHIPNPSNISPENLSSSSNLSLKSNMLNKTLKVKWKFLDKSIKSRLIFRENGSKMTILNITLEDSGKFLCFKQQDIDDDYKEKFLLSTCVLHVEKKKQYQYQIVYILLGTIFPSILLFMFLVTAYWAHQKYKKPKSRSGRVVLYNVIHENLN